MLRLKSNFRIGISLGDPCGIGPEITIKALQDSDVRNLAAFTVIGPSSAMQCIPKSEDIECVAIADASLGPFVPGQWGTDSGRVAFLTLQKSVELLKSGHISALVTAPVSKEAIRNHDRSFQGHTEFLAGAFGIENVGMMFVGESLRTIIVTRHIPLKDVSAAVTREAVMSTICLCDRAFKELFGLKNPAIGVCGLNPHAGENGLMGREEIETIAPAVEQARLSGINASGPFPADTVFSRDFAKKYDVIVAIYHDQGLIPVKTLSIKKLVNLTVGLPFIRTSPAHGTAFDIAGQNIADAESMKEAIKLAVKLTKCTGTARCVPTDI